MCRRQIYLTCFVLVLALMVGGVLGGLTDPPLVNPSFEDPALDPGATSSDINGWWDALNYTLTADEGSGVHPQTPYGDNWAELGNGRWLYQQIGTYERDMDIDISFLLGQKSGNNHVGLTVELFAGGNAQLAADVNAKRDAAGFPLDSVVGAVLIAASDQLNPFTSGGVMEAVEMSLRLSTGPGGPGYAPGDPLWLVFSRPSANGRTLIDNVVVTAVAKNVATNPDPADGASDVPRDVVLSWTPGVFAAPTNGHKVYFGESFNDVNDAAGGVAQDANSYTPAQRLDFGTTYYWRVDEVNAPPTSHIEFKGNVWSFTTEPIAYPIDGNNITATASSSDVGQGPENTVNRSGLDANDLHSIEMTDMWLSNAADASTAWIQYEFDKVYKLYQMWVWNHNTAFEVVVGFGFKDVTIEYSTNGTDWTVLAVVTEFAQGTGSPDYTHNMPVDFDGVVAKYVKITANSNWSAGLTTQYGLSEVRFFYIPVWAREPSPEDEATGVGPDVVLNWRAGREAATHDVYLSSKRTAVRNGTALAGTVTEASYDAGALDLGETYYWKINEVNMAETPTTWEGDIWSFATPEYFVVEDFEDYNDFEPDRIFETWKGGYGYTGYCGNGTGSAVGHPSYPYAEQTIVHGDSQSMPLYYDNSATGTNSCGEPISLYYSEAGRVFDAPQDWTKYAIKALTLWFHGDPSNDATEQMYVKLNGSKVTYGGHAEAIRLPWWQQWNIDLQDFTGVNLSNVTELSIGFEPSGVSGGSGVVYFDDIRLYPARCVPDVVKPASDLNDDCVVDYLDLEIVSNDWLLTDSVIATSDPGSLGEEVHLEFDGNLLDSSANGRNGSDLAGTVVYSTGKSGQAICLDGTNYVEIPGYKGISGGGAFSLSAWIRTAANGSVLSWGTDGSGTYMDFRVDTVIRIQHGAGNIRGTLGPDLRDTEWHQVAVVVEENCAIQDAVLYVDGLDVSPTITDTDLFNLGDLTDVSIGYRATSADRYFTGMIDDVRIYSRALSSAEIAYLADESPGDGQLHISPSVAELYAGEPAGSRKIDLKDFTALADEWLDEQLWP